MSHWVFEELVHTGEDPVHTAEWLVCLVRALTCESAPPLSEKGCSQSKKKKPTVISCTSSPSFLASLRLTHRGEDFLMSFRLLQSVSYTHVQLLQSVYIIDRQRGENSSGRYLEVIIGKLIWGNTGEWQLIVYLLCCCDARRKAARLHLEHLYNKKKHRHTYTYIYVCTHTHLKATAPAWDMWGIPTEPCWSSRGK